MKNILKYVLAVALLTLPCVAALAQTDRKEVRAGNRQFKKGHWQNAEIEYRKAQAKDTSSFAANYNLAGALYREGNFDEAGKSMERLKDVAPMSANSADYYYNLGNIAVQKKDWKSAVDAYRQSLLRNPGDMDAKENYAYAKQMLKNEGGGGGNDDQKNQDKNNNQNNDQNQNGQNNNDQSQDNNQNNNQDQNQNNDQNKDQNQGDQPKPQQGEGQGDAKMSPQQAQQMLKAVQAREKETQDKVNKEKAALLKSRQKEKNW